MAFVVSNTFLHDAVFSHCFPKANNLSHINIVFKALIQCKNDFNVLASSQVLHHSAVSLNCGWWLIAMAT